MRDIPQLPFRHGSIGAVDYLNRPTAPEDKWTTLGAFGMMIIVLIIAVFIA